MHHIKAKLSVILLSGLGLTGLQAQQTIPATGGLATGSGGTVSYTVGQVADTTQTGSGGTVTQGVQQPFEIWITVDPPVAADQETCYGKPVPDLTATGENIKWYSDTELLTLVHSGSPFATGKTTPGVYTYYVTQTVDDDESEAVEVVLTIYDIPYANVTDSTNISCYGFADGTAVVTPTGGTSPYSFLWDDDLNSTGSTVTGLSANKWYHAVVADINECTATDSVMLTEPDQMTISKDFTPKICPDANDGYISLTVSDGTLPYSFSWSTGDLTDSIGDLSAGIYKVTITDAEGCTLNDSTLIDSLTTYQGSEICLVTVNNDNRILVVWEKTYNKGIAYYNIYREQSSKDNYVKIATIPFDSLSVYEDKSSVPEENPYFYKISITDSCGKESDLSPLHKSIHLLANLGVNNEVNLNWDEYEGFEYYEYEIYRGSAITELFSIRTISASIRSWSDKSAPSGKNYYRILVVKPTACFPTYLKSLEYSSPFSNYDEETLTGMSETETGGFSIYPNPFSDRTTITFNNPNFKKHQLILMDLTGKVIRQIGDITGSRIELSRENLSPGVYLIELRGADIYRGMVVVE
jgi:hypothetical protein